MVTCGRSAGTRAGWASSAASSNWVDSATPHALAGRGSRRDLPLPPRGAGATASALSRCFVDSRLEWRCRRPTSHGWLGIGRAGLQPRRCRAGESRLQPLKPHVRHCCPPVLQGLKPLSDGQLSGGGAEAPPSSYNRTENLTHLHQVLSLETSDPTGMLISPCEPGKQSLCRRSLSTGDCPPAAEPRKKNSFFARAMRESL